MSSVFVSTGAPFAERLAETIAFCRARARGDEPKHSLRTSTLWLLAADRGQIIELVAISRKHAVRYARPATDRDVRPATKRADLEGGRLLVYFPDLNLADGAAEAASNGFFDVHDVPPCDTWVGLGVDLVSRPNYGTYVISWVPPPLIALASAGIDVNPLGSIAWLEDCEIGARVELAHLLHR